ncbi:hypothetical protein BAUCODRAFT_63730 [Baudoinia panamericana UAMH 10762]|uniref:NOL1/NOP2/Sun domain family member 4 n=1 Tax=Baudoinia panamericana (strain UAMH 10762) TaxID=717646 RepID=M2LY45_BAUPA|nr:uncharacterized protein BAUCODRAFT_63730 [Baudoinia panamericana UAMH 10762]EMC99622.1 hypothetical protein BAUCODRAFT_63730 [Baudoinia panamericana UAMH 10762]
MTKTTRNTAAATEESFHKHYSAIWGGVRWQTSLYPALSAPTRYCALVNRYVPAHEARRALQSGSNEPGALPESLQQLNFPNVSVNDGKSAQASIGPICYVRPAPSSGEKVSRVGSTAAPLTFPPPQPAGSTPMQLLTHWNLDAASALAVSVLNVQTGDSVLDLCAAPGGKSVALAQSMWPHLHADSPVEPSGRMTGRLVSNEADGRRQKRLAENLQAYLPPQLFKQGAVSCTRVDASISGPSLNALLAGGSFDKVLVDAPCSSERHIIHAHLKAQGSGNLAPEMANWRSGSSKRLAKTQVELLMTALKAVKIGGQVMYATCSIEPTENDGVLEKMLALLGFPGASGASTMDEQLEQWAERTKHGWMVLPDHPGGGRWGPLYFALVTKIAG